ncbi:MAG: hypothetical protein A2Y41_01360 [Spirochaetes bacterium GWB1_36_13]|nr:MAG: hypothetical protein A2Y41_01360 [Spirochaetes bacterium GWB1_36_13]
MKNMELLTNESITDKKKNKKLDWVIYLLAVIAFALMIVVIMYNSKTSIEILEPEKTIQSNYQEQIKEQLKQQQIEESINTKEQQDNSVITNDTTKTTDNTQTTTDKTTETTTEKVTDNKNQTTTEDQKTVDNNDQKITEDTSLEYNNEVLKRYPVKPSQNLKIAGSYKVKKGDALWKIAKQFNVKTINIVAINGKLNNPDFIYPGQVISIPNQ